METDDTKLLFEEKEMMRQKIRLSNVYDVLQQWVKDTPQMDENNIKLADLKELIPWLIDEGMLSSADVVTAVQEYKEMVGDYDSANSLRVVAEAME